MMDIIIFIPTFIIAVILAFYIPGRVVLGFQNKLSRIGIIAVSFVLGIVLWGWQGYILGFLHLRLLSYLYLLVFAVIFIKKRYYFFRFYKFPKFQLKKIDLIAGLIIILGIFGQIMPFIKTGLVSTDGLFISTYNYCDHIWHAALASELATRFPPNEPGLSGILLTNYNFWFHLVTGELSRVFFLPLLSVQFTGLYPLASILLAITGYIFAINLYNSKLFTRLFLFFLFFSGDAIGWLFSVLNKSLMLNMSQGFDDATKFMDTPGYGFSVVISLAAFYLLLKYKQNLSRKNILIIGALIGSLIGFKIYMGIPFLLGFLVLGLFGFFKKNFSYFWIFIIAAILSAVQFLPFNANSGGLFFLLFEVPRGFIAQKGLNLGYIDQHWTIYLEKHNYFRLLEYGLFMTALYLFVQFGVKLLGFIPLKRTFKILGTEFFVLLYSIFLCSLVLGMFFYQRVGGGNIWQFLLPMSLMLTIFASLNLSIILSNLNKVIITILIILIVIFTIPSWISFVGNYFYADYLSMFHGVSASELKSYDFIKSNSSKDSMLLLVDQPNYGNCSASLVKVLSERKLFFSGPGASQIIIQEYIRRKNNVEFIKQSKDDKEVIKVLKNNGINYIFIYNNTPIATNSPLLKNKFLDKVFLNESTKIFKVN